MPQKVVIKQAGVEKSAPADEPTKKPAAKRAPAAPRDRQPKAVKPKPVDHPNPNAIDLSDEDAGPQEIPVKFLKDDDIWYNAHMPKGTLALALGQEMQEMDQSDMDQMKALVSRFVRLLFSQADYDAIMARLDSEDDRLDLVHIKVLINRISARTGGLPTT